MMREKLPLFAWGVMVGCGVGLMSGMVLTRMTLDIHDADLYPATLNVLTHQNTAVQESFQVANEQFLAMTNRCEAVDDALKRFPPLAPERQKWTKGRGWGSTP